MQSCSEFLTVMSWHLWNLKRVFIKQADFFPVHFRLTPQSIFVLFFFLLHLSHTLLLTSCYNTALQDESRNKNAQWCHAYHILRGNFLFFFLFVASPWRSLEAMCHIEKHLTELFTEAGLLLVEQVDSPGARELCHFCQFWGWISQFYCFVPMPILFCFCRSTFFSLGFIAHTRTI